MKAFLNVGESCLEVKNIQFLDGRIISVTVSKNDDAIETYYEGKNDFFNGVHSIENLEKDISFSGMHNAQIEKVAAMLKEELAEHHAMAHNIVENEVDSGALNDYYAQMGKVAALMEVKNLF